VDTGRVMSQENVKTVLDAIAAFNRGGQVETGGD
jgi:hypothetical protein